MVPVFSSHNVLLPDGTETAPGMPLVADSQACLAGLRELDKVFGDARKGVTVADLGSLEGGYAAEFARAGYSVTGFEAREENISNAMWLRDALGMDLTSLHFVQGDVRETLGGRQFDAVFCSGLLYHLDKPVEFLNLLGSVTRELLILNTHYSMGPEGHPESSHHPGDWCEFGDLVHEGRRGHWYHEQTDDRYASYGNRKSFWLLKEELLASIADAGFRGEITEVTDWKGLSGSAHVLGGPGMVNDRGMFTALKTLQSA